jgi:Cysteine-rich CPXCG
MPRYFTKMDLINVMCPTCGEYFEVAMPHSDELPAEMDYDCEICCRPLLLVFDQSGGYARGIGE